MHFVQKYLEKIPMPSISTNATTGKKSANIYLYCNYYSFYSQKVQYSEVYCVHCFVLVTYSIQYSDYR